MSMSPTPSLRIGELADQAGVRPKTVRYYESIGLLPAPDRLPNGYRAYSQADVTRLRFIRRARRLGLSLDAIRDILRCHGSGAWPCRHVRQRAEQRLAEIDRQIAELQRLRDSLAALAARAAVTEDEQSAAGDRICPAVETAP